MNEAVALLGGLVKCKQCDNYKAVHNWCSANKTSRIQSPVPDKWRKCECFKPLTDETVENGRNYIERRIVYHKRKILSQQRDIENRRKKLLILRIS